MKKEISDYLNLSALVLLILSAIATTCYLLMLGWYNTLTLDDYSWSSIESLGVWNWMKSVYMTWEGRWSAFTIDACIWKIWAHASNMIMFTVIHLAIGYVTTYCLLRKILSVARFDWLLLTFSILVVNLSILALQEISTFYWLCCPHYVMCVWAFMWLCNLLFLTKQFKWWHVPFIVLLSLYLSGLAETFTPLVIMLLGIKWLFNIFKDKRYNFILQPSDRYLTISLVVLVIGFLIMVFAPGNKVRVETMSENSFINNFVLTAFCYKWAKATVILLLRFISKSLYYATVMIIAMFIGYKYRESLVNSKIILSAKQILIVIVGLLLFFAISVAPCVYAMGWYAPPRSFSYMSFAFAFCAIWIGLSIGAQSQHPNVIILSTGVVALCLTILSSIWIAREQPVVSKYHDWVMECRATIQQKIDEHDNSPYVTEGYQFPAERNTYSRMCIMMGKNRIEYQYPYMLFNLSKDPKHWKNVALKDYMHADFDIIGWGDSE